MTEPDSEPIALSEAGIDEAGAGFGGECVRAAARRTNGTLYMCNFLSKGWEVSILGMLAFIQAKYELPLYTVGILSMVFIVSQICISLFTGKLAHVLHSRNVIFLSIGASSLAWATLCLSHTPMWLYAAFMFGGISSGLFEPIGNSLVAKLAESGNRNTAIGNFAAFGDMGKIAVVAGTTALAGLLGVTNASMVLLGTTVVALVLAVTFIPNPKAIAAEAASEEAPVHLRELLRNGKFRLATWAGIADSFSSASLYIFIPFLLTSKGIDLDKTLYFNVIFFVGYMSGRLALGRLADKHGAANMLMASKVAMAALIVVVVLANGALALGVLLFLLGIFTRGSAPIIRAMVADAMHENTSFHDAFATFSFASRGSSAACRPIYGFLASLAGISWVFYASSIVSLMTLYPAQRYKTAAGHPRDDEAAEPASHGKGNQENAAGRRMEGVIGVTAMAPVMQSVGERVG